MDTAPVFDWSDKGFVKALFVLILWRMVILAFHNGSLESWFT